MERLSLIDVSSEDDLLFFPSTCDDLIDPASSTGNQENKDMSQVDVADDKQGNSPVRSSKQMELVLHFSESPEHKQGKSPVRSNKQMELILHLSESPKHKQAKSAKFNLRKSLAWDNAFFTSEGVLDPEELAVVNSTFRKVEASTLLAIPEDTRKSVESTSTIDNDSWDLENLEVDLFENVRASIQRSLGNAGKASKIARPGTKIAPLNIDLQLVESAEEIEPSSNNKKKPNLASERTSNHQHSQIAIRDSQSTSKIGTQGNTHLKTALKPPRILSISSLPTMPRKESKTTATGSSQIVKNNAKAVPGDAGSQKTVKVANSSNGVPGSRNIRSLLLRTSSTLSGSSQNSLSKSSDSASNSKLPVTKKISASKNVQQLSSGSNSHKIPVKTTRTSGISNKASSPNMLPSSTVNLYSGVSPSSSFDSVASEASSSASNTSKLAQDYSDAGSSSLSTSLAVPNKYLVNSTSIHRHARNGSLPLGNHLQNEPLSKASQEESLASENARGDHIRVYTNNTYGGKCFKPSGLRMPTPKFGYFDAEKNKIANVEKLPCYSQQNNIMKITNRANVPNDFVAGATKSNMTSKLKSEKLPISATSSNNTVASSDSPSIENDLVSACSVEFTLVKELSESAKSHRSSDLTESHPELTTPNVVKGLSSTKERSSESKSSQDTEASGDKGAHDELTNLLAKQDAADKHKDCTISKRKCSEHVDERRIDKDSDSLAITTGKENVFPVVNSWPQQTLS